MEVAVRYHSRGGNTEKVAKSIGNALGLKAQSVAAGLSAPVDLLFLGSALYGGRVDPTMDAFLQGLTAETVKVVAVFSTAARDKSAHGQVKELLEARGIHVLPEYFHCKGKFLMMNRGRPDGDDLARAAEFAKQLVKG